MTDYNRFLSSAGSKMIASAIRQAGALGQQGRDIVSFAPGFPAPETFPWTEFQAMAKELLTGSDPFVLQYGPTRGYRPLLEAIVEVMAKRGVTSTLDSLLVTTGSQQGLDVVGRVLLSPGDVILVELPTYTGAIMAFRNVEAEMVGVPQEGDGIDLAALDETHQRLQRQGRRCRILYLVPNFQNPTGLLISLAKRKALLEWAERRDVLIVEDDPYRDIYFEGSATEADIRPIKADDVNGRVVYMSTFSKTLAPGLRVAWIDAPAPIAQKIEFCKQAADLCAGTLDQRIVHEACRQGVLDRQAPMLRAHYGHKRDVMVTALRREFGSDVTWEDARGGFFLWTRLPEGLDAQTMGPRAFENGVVYVPGQGFFVNGSGREFIRLSFSAASPERIDEGVRRLAKTIREESAAQSAGPRVQAAL